LLNATGDVLRVIARPWRRRVCEKSPWQ